MKKQMCECSETGEIWLSEFYDIALDENILQVIAINIAEPEPEPIIEGKGTYASKSWYEAYKTILKDWTTIDQYGDFSYLKMYFDLDYQTRQRYSIHGFAGCLLAGSWNFLHGFLGTDYRCY